MNTHSNHWTHQIDWVLLLALIGLASIGVAFIYSAASVHGITDPTHWYQHRFFRQILACLLGFGFAFGVCLVDYHLIARWSMLFYWGAIAMLLLVLFTEPVHGVQRWISFGPIRLQPSEFAKIATICALGNFLSRPLDELRVPSLFFQSLGLIGLPFCMILIEPDLGSALVLIPVGLVMMFIAGIPKVFLARLVSGSFILILLVVVDTLFFPKLLPVVQLEEYQKNRLRVYFGMSFASSDATPEEKRRADWEERNAKYNVDQALISVGSGGMTGKGWCQGTQNALGYLPKKVAHNDFIFSVIAEEWGFLGSMTVLLLNGIVIIQGLRIASQARDRMGKVIATGVVMLWFSHVFINIGMNIRLMPVTGLPLPLLSDGGSSALSFMMAMGLLQNVKLYKRNY
ncbi:MAG: rod shape-determining protein RodA [Verrucomicrobia bacterium]|jgi:rod shape determining protein RodA|nr:rod shape-determining protein RodA [Verrucomicrobiota bacterium]